jgi:hypothetical protein
MKVYCDTPRFADIFHGMNEEMYDTVGQNQRRKTYCGLQKHHRAVVFPLYIHELLTVCFLDFGPEIL